MMSSGLVGEWVRWMSWRLHWDKWSLLPQEGKTCSNHLSKGDSTDSCHEQRTYRGLGHCSAAFIFPPTPAQGSLFTSTPHNRKMHNKKPQTTRQAVRI